MTRTIRVACLIAAVFAGCASRGPGARRPEAHRGIVDTPPYEEIAASYNARVATQERIWARSVARVWYPDREGGEQTDQVEGQFMMIRPDRLLLTFKKLGETYAVLGSNAEKYWWIELGEERVAWVGEHARVSAERTRELGLPVHPLDLLEMIGVLPLPEPAPVGAGGPAPGVRRLPDGRLEVRVPSRAHAGRAVRAIRYTLDPDTLEPRRIELLDDAGEPVLTSELTRYEAVALAQGRAGGGLATRMEASIDGGRRRMRLWLMDAENRGGKPDPASFDLDRVLRNYRVSDVRSIDDGEG